MNVSNQLLDILGTIAVKAGIAIMEVYDGEIVAESKSDDSPLTVADLRAHDIITEQLGAAFPGVLIWSEESCTDLLDGTDHQTFFLVDPLDGTKEFIKRNGEFTVNIALIRAGAAIAGVVYLPATCTLYFGGTGLGAWRRCSKGTKELSIVDHPPAVPLRVIGSRSHTSPDMDAWLRSLPCAHAFVAAGSSPEILQGRGRRSGHLSTPGPDQPMGHRSCPGNPGGIGRKCGRQARRPLTVRHHAARAESVVFRNGAWNRSRIHSLA